MDPVFQMDLEQIQRKKKKKKVILNNISELQGMLDGANEAQN